MRIYKTFIFSLIGVMEISLAQVEPVSGLRENPPRVWVLTNGTIHTEPGKTIEHGAVLLRDGIIQAVGRGLAIPSDAAEIDLNGANVYAGFIESWLPVTEPEKKEDQKQERAHWNDKVRADRNPLDFFRPKEDDLTELRKLGFTSAHLVADDGIFKGQSALVQLGTELINIQSQVSNVVGFEFGGWGDPNPPNSLLGCIALIRQTFLDANWYGKAIEIMAEYPEENEPLKDDLSLAVLSQALENNDPFIFSAPDESYILRSIKIAKEYELNLWIKGSGYEYKQLDRISERNPFIILPVNFPGNPKVANPHQALQYSTAQLRHWDLAPDNMQKLIKADVSVALTSADLNKRSQFRKNLERMIERGLTEKDALEALTTRPAEYMDVADRFGKIAKGYFANLVVVDGSYFDSEAPVRSVWISGREFSIHPTPLADLTGDWNLIVNSDSLLMKFKGDPENLKAEVQVDSTWKSINNLILDEDRLTFTMELDSLETRGINRFVGHISEDLISGKFTDPDGNEGSWTGNRTAEAAADTSIQKTNEPASSLTIVYPEGAYGLEQEPETLDRIFINDATIWTCSSEGTLNGWDLLVENGKIKRIAPQMTVPRGGAHVIEANGKHVTPGLIDCHSHMAGISINEGTQANTAEVRMQDVIDPDDIAIYRALAGGLTTINLLHGSANPIGGQNVVLKLRWGKNAEGLKFKKAPEGIKFALGENVKRSNWDDPTNRYPKTRMGVEQIIRDAFRSAKDYNNRWAVYHRDTKARRTKVPPRMDLELEAMLEIMEGKRRVHCHSYRQDEILMLTRVAEDFGFRIATFQHVLEGYKVAERIQEHGAGASTFSDWWAYKFEVIDAIPYNGALMTNTGVNVSFNSDSNELARRMNLEAAKGVKYGGLSENEAIKLVTINPAKQLGIDEWVGSLEEGKDADFVIWNGHPLSSYTSCEETWIEGKQYFSIEKDLHLRIRDQRIRNELIQKILGSKDTGAEPEEPEEEREPYSCWHNEEIYR